MTFEQLMEEYTGSPIFRRLSPSTRESRLYGLRNAAGLWSDKLENITRFKVNRLLDELYSTPGKCRVTMGALRAVLEFGRDRGHIDTNVAAGISFLPKTNDIPRWSARDVDLFLSKAPDYVARVAAVALYTGQRRSDIIRMRWSDIIDGKIMVRQQKTGKELELPIHPKLNDYLVAPKKNSIFVLWNKHGQPWAANSVTIAVRREAERIGLSNLTLHGLRKSAASTLAEKGATVAQVAAITGQSLKEIERYTRQADQAAMAVQAMEKWT